MQITRVYVAGYPLHTNLVAKEQILDLLKRRDNPSGETEHRQHIKRHQQMHQCYQLCETWKGSMERSTRGHKLHQKTRSTRCPREAGLGGVSLPRALPTRSNAPVRGTVHTWKCFGHARQRYETEPENTES